jgi:hypothetical protein
MARPWPILAHREHEIAGSRVHHRAGTRLAGPRATPMMNVFMAGPDLVRWDITAVEQEGPYRLTIQHRHGSIVEYFSTTTAALLREAEIEEMLTGAACAGR